MILPDSLKPENCPQEIDPESKRMLEAMKRYVEEMGDDLITEPSSYTDGEWADMLNECVEKHITIWELWGEEYDPEADY